MYHVFNRPRFVVWRCIRDTGKHSEGSRQYELDGSVSQTDVVELYLQHRTISQCKHISPCWQ